MSHPRGLYIQIFGTKKCFDQKKPSVISRNVGGKFQFIDMKEKGLSKGEFNAVKQEVGGLNNMLDPNCEKWKQATVGYAPEVWKTWN